MYTAMMGVPHRSWTSVTSPTLTPRAITGAPLLRPVTAESKKST
jgi:hypothetical protein